MEKPTQISRVRPNTSLQEGRPVRSHRSQAGQTAPTLTIAQPNVRERQIDVPHDITPSLLGLASLHSPLQLFLGHILDVGGDPPLVLVSVSNTSGPVSVKLVRRLPQRGCSRLERSLVRRINILRVDVNHGRK